MFSLWKKIKNKKKWGIKMASQYKIIKDGEEVILANYKPEFKSLWFIIGVTMLMLLFQVFIFENKEISIILTGVGLVIWLQSSSIFDHNIYNVVKIKDKIYYHNKSTEHLVQINVDSDHDIKRLIDNYHAISTNIHFFIVVIASIFFLILLKQ